MNSPFYEAEQRALYPHRILCTGGTPEVVKHMEYLIKNDFDTLDNMRETSLGELKRKYFINATSYEILDAFDRIRNSPDLQTLKGTE